MYGGKTNRKKGKRSNGVNKEGVIMGKIWQRCSR